MKKVLLIIALFLLIVGCEKKEETKEIEDYYINYNNSEIKLNTVFQNVIINIGMYNDKHSTISTFQNKEIEVYEYDSFEIETYLDNNVEKVYAITFTNEEIQTREGIKIGDNKNDILNTYGNPTTENEFVYSYNINNTNVSFILNNDIIMGIEYYIS